MTGENGVGESLRALALAGDLAELRRYVDSLGRGDAQAARDWVAAVHDLTHHHGPPELAGLPWEERWQREATITAGLLLVVGRLESPAAAVRAVMRLTRFNERDPARATVAAFTDRDRTWAQAFARAADATRAPRDRGHTLTVLLRHVVLAHELPVPRGGLFHTNWIRVYPGWSGEHALADAMRVDPLMPDVLLHQLSAGEAGRNPGLPDAVQQLVDEGWVDRDRVLGVVIDQLTASSRVGSQRVLVGIAERLGLITDDIPGGLAYVLAVLSSAHGSVAQVVLPLGIELVRTREELLDLSRTVGARSEKGVRRLLLRALSPDRLGERFTHADLAAAIDALSGDEQDVALRRAYDKALLALGAAPAVQEDHASDALGLWGLSGVPTNPRPDVPSFLGSLRDRCWRQMRTGAPGNDPRLDDHLLDAVLHDEFTADDLLATAHELAVEGRLSPTRVAAVLEPLFLGGAMRAMWPVALQIADLCASGPRPVAGLDRLVRMLASYAAEPPRPVDLPSHLLGLSGGTSKVAQEVERLAIRLGSSMDVGTPPVTALGLWREGTERSPWGLSYPPTRDLSTIGRRVHSPYQRSDLTSSVRRSTLASLLLDELAALVVEHGVDQVRAAVAAEERDTWAGWFAQAVMLWAGGLLTPESYWAMAGTSLTSSDLREQWATEMGDQKATEKYFDWQVSDGIDLDPPVMPRWWGGDDQGLLTRVQFQHTCEVLLVIEGGGRVVSTPDRVDGSLGLDHLLERLTAAPRVGPMDLRLALGRLRPVWPRGTTMGDPGAWAPTDRDVTAPTRDREDSSAAVLHRWFTTGGLRLTARRGEQPGVAWEHDHECAVPWQSCAALATTAVHDGPPRTRTQDVWSLPGRADLWLRHGFRPGPDESLADVGGSIGVTGWDAILTSLGQPPQGSYGDPDFAALVRLQDQGRLDPATAAAAATARWDEGLPDFIGSALGWERAFLRGAMRGLWPVAVAVVEAGMARSERPADLDGLVGVLRRRAHEAPRDAVPRFLEHA